MDPVKSKESETPLKQIRTFQGDVAEAIQKQQESLVSIQQAEHLKGDSVESATPASLEESRKRKEFFFLLSGGIVLLILGTVGVWYTYNEFVRKTATPITDVSANRFVSVNSEINLDLTAVTSRDTLISALSGARENVPTGELTHIILPLSTGEFLKILESRAPGSLVRAFDPLFMFGGFGESAFLIIKLSSFENAFAGMLAWEKNLSQDIGPLFVTAPLLKNILLDSVFRDLTDRNKDIREILVEDQPILLYSFFDNNMLVITDHIETLRTLIDRLTREKLSR